MITSLESRRPAAGQAAGADAYLVKREVARDELVALLRRLTGRREPAAHRGELSDGCWPAWRRRWPARWGSRWRPGLRVPLELAVSGAAPASWG